MDEPILPDAPKNKSRNMAEVLNEVFLETANDIQNVEMRWEKTIGSIFSSLKKTVSHFFVSRVKSDEVNQVQSSIRRLFMKSDYEEKIRVDAELQNVFLLGYCQAVEHMIDLLICLQQLIHIFRYIADSQIIIFLKFDKLFFLFWRHIFIFQILLLYLLFYHIICIYRNTHDPKKCYPRDHFVIDHRIFWYQKLIISRIYVSGRYHACHKVTYRHKNYF